MNTPAKIFISYAHKDERIIDIIGFIEGKYNVNYIDNSIK